LDKNTQIFLETVVLSQKNSFVARIFLFPSGHGDGEFDLFFSLVPHAFSNRNVIPRNRATKMPQEL